ncbi:MAG: hypothetical protein HC836_24280 [Richelia sp. RM2_1_2]|nr:hypothetical protein [Richelia sp. RM2_1_2]
MTEEMPLVGTRMKLDLVNITRKIIIETCGKQHEKYVPFFHKNNEQELLKQMKRDLSKSKWAEINGFSYIEIYERDLPLKKEFFEEMGVNL